MIDNGLFGLKTQTKLSGRRFWGGGRANESETGREVREEGRNGRERRARLLACLFLLLLILCFSALLCSISSSMITRPDTEPCLLFICSFSHQIISYFLLRFPLGSAFRQIVNTMVYCLLSRFNFACIVIMGGLTEYLFYFIFPTFLFS